jgi:magnesium chelatase family protein
MAHNGVLFLDELPEFPRIVLEVMRQPLEERRVTIARAQMTLTFPASFVLVAASNPWGRVAFLRSALTDQNQDERLILKNSIR